MTRRSLPTGAGPLRRRAFAFLQRQVPRFAVLLLFLFVARLIWRDTTAWSAPTFYLLPLPLYVLLFAGLWLLSWKQRKIQFIVCLIMAALLGWHWQRETKKLRRDLPASVADGPRVFLWNLGHTHEVPPALQELLGELAPDVVVLPESENLGASGFAEIAQRHPGFRAVELQSGVSCLVRGDFTPPQSRQLGDRVWVNLLTATFSRIPGEWRLCLTDIPPWPPLPRAKYLDAIRAAAGSGPRTIIAGDFNTPLDSAGFDSWREALHHGFADCAAWRGPLETWCFGVPVLTIDHIWMSRDLAPVRARKESRFGKDHSWLFVECGTAAP